jgi:4-hydroxybenzoate polyprenyltransferase
MVLHPGVARGGGLARSLAEAASDIKLHHSVFALPFALLGAMLAAVTPQGVPWAGMAGPLALIVGCMVFARTVAMLANRIADAAIDARNPRTAGRAIPSGRLSRRVALWLVFLSILAFEGCVMAFAVVHGNVWPLVLQGPVLLWLVLYPFAKRFTWLCHAWLGASLAMSVPAAALAMRPEAALLPVIWWIAGMVLLWVTGFDVIYALQDVEADRREGLHSMPARLGTGPALVTSLLMHVGAVLCLVQAWRVEPRLGSGFLVAVGLVTGLLAVEHATVRRWGTTRMALTFFALNGCVSVVLGTAGMLGLVGIGR